MEFDPEDQEIVKLLSKLKDADAKYPEDLLAARRRSYLKGISEVGLGVVAEKEIEQVAKDIKPPTSVAPVSSTLLEIALVVAIIAESGAVAYFYRDKLADFFRTISAEARGQEVTAPPVVPTTLEIQGITPSPAITPTLPAATVLTTPTPPGMAVTPIGTPIPSIVVNNNNSGGVILLDSTPAPNGIEGNNDDSGNNGNNGHHYGQTPKPERTKENGNNPPPKEDKPPKDQKDNPPQENKDKPPKDNNGNPPNDNNGQPPNDKPPKEKKN